MVGQALELAQASTGAQSPPLAMDSVTCCKGQPSKQGHLLPQRGPSQGSPDSHLTFLGRGDPSRPLGTRGNVTDTRAVLDHHPNTGDQEYLTSICWTTCMVQRGGRCITWGRCRPTCLPLTVSTANSDGWQQHWLATVLACFQAFLWWHPIYKQAGMSGLTTLNEEACTLYETAVTRLIQLRVIH